MSASKTIKQILGHTQPHISYGVSIELVFSAFDEKRGIMRRKRVKLNRYGDVDYIKQRESDICKRFDDMLSSGWNPFSDSGMARKCRVSVTETDAFTHSRKNISVDKAFEDYNVWLQTELERKVMTLATVKTYQSYIKNLLPYIKSCKIEYLDDVSASVLRCYIDSLTAKKLSVKYCNSVLGFLKTVFGWFVERSYIRETPADVLTKETEARICTRSNLTESDLERLFSKLRSTGRLEFLAACMIEYYCYIRPNELYRLQVANFDFKNQRIYVPASVSKNKCDGVVTMPEVVRDVLLELRINEHNLNDYVFGSRLKCCNKIGTVKQFGRYWENHISCASGLCPDFSSRHITFYSLKSTGITNMLESGVAPIVVRNQARHSNITTTEIYARCSTLTASVELKDYK